MPDKPLKPNPIAKLSAVLFKIVVAIACLYYIIKCGRNIKLEDIRPSFIPTALLAAIAYFLATFLMVYGWQVNLITISGRKETFKLFAKIYFRSVPAKYLPSNIMHFAARHYQAIQAGYSHGVVATSNILENILITISACGIIIAGILSGRLEFPTEFLNKSVCPQYIIPGAFVAVILLLIFVNKKFGRQVRFGTAVKALTKILAGYAVFLIVTGFIFLQVMNIAVPQNLNEHWDRIILIYICAWTIGLVTPGAPGGLGVRESVIIYLTSGLLTSDQALLGALLFRIVTVTGEIMGYYFARFLK